MMSQYGQLTENGTIQGCAKIVFSLHTARIENPYTPQTYSSASNFDEYHSDTPRHPSDSSQKPPRYPQGTLNANTQQQMPRNTPVAFDHPVLYLSILDIPESNIHGLRQLDATGESLPLTATTFPVPFSPLSGSPLSPERRVPSL